MYTQKCICLVPVPFDYGLRPPLSVSDHIFTEYTKLIFGARSQRWPLSRRSGTAHRARRP